MRVSGDGKGPDAVAVPASPALQATYSLHRASVRGSLVHFGVAPADLDDMCHEVFLVVHAQRDQMVGVRHLNLWLRAICWRVAAAYRRRGHRRHEIPVDDFPEVADGGSDRPLDEIERHQQREALLRALDKLNDETRDLLALHDLGDVPMTTIAELLECDRKTAHKRLAIARRSLARLLRDGHAGREELGGYEHTKDLRPFDPADSSLLNDFLQVLELTPNLNVGLIGNVIVTCWRGGTPVKAFEILESHFDDIAEVCNDRSVYFAIVGATSRPPPLDSRKKILEMLRTYERSIQAYGTALQGGMAWIARPIMTGLSRLVRTEFPMRFFNGIDAAAAWLAPYSRGSDGPVTAPALAAAALHLTQLRAPSGGHSEHASSSRRSSAR